MSNKSRVIRVFLSSTFRDFAEERDLLVRKVFPELRRLCRERQVELVEVDLRWGITEEEAQQGKVLPICLGEIDRARPYFMGFIGDRYGWVPEGSQYPVGIVEREPWLKEHQGGKSVTELEMLHGVLNNPEMAGRAFFYFRDSNYSRSKGGDYCSEDAASAAKLEALKDRIRDSQFPVVEDYADPQALADKVRADLRKLIEEEYPADEVPDDLTLARMRHEAYSQARRGLYIGGEQYFAQLDAALSGEAPQPVLISGEAGLGKSALIASWLQGWRAKHPKTPVILHHLNATAEADDPMHLVRRLGEEAALITGRPFEAAKSKDEILEQMPSILADLSGHAEREGLSVLIVLDGLERCGAAFEDLRWFPKYVPPCIYLLASCSEGAAKEQLHNLTLEWATIELEPLSAAQGRDFIERYLKTYRKSLTPAQADRILAHPLSGRPLWLITLLEELRLFGVHEELEARLDTLLSDPPSKAAGEAPTIDDVYEHVLARIEEDIDEDYEVAAFKALWASFDGLARSELLELTGMPPAKWAEIQNALDENLFESGGQITFGNDFIRKAVEDRHLPTDADKVDAHRWLGEWFEAREVTLDVAQERVHQWREAGDRERLRATLLEEAVFKELYEKDEFALLAHWLWLGEDIEQAYEGVFEQWQEELELEVRLGLFLASAGYLQAFTESLYRRALEGQEQALGAAHPDTLGSVNNLANLLSNKGDYAAAEPLYRRALEGQEQALGAAHPDTLGSVNNLANLLSNKGDYAAAEPLYRRALEGQEQALGAAHPSTLASVNNLAELLRIKGDYEAAEPLYRRALEGREQALGAAHPDTLTSVNNLALLLSSKGDYEAAEPLYRRALEGREQALGAAHPDTLNSVNNLAELLRIKGDYEAAEPLYRRALEGYEQALGAAHPDTLDSVNNLAVLLSDKGDYEAAEPLYRRALEGKEQALGAAHPSTLTSVNNLAELLRIKGDYEAAEPLYRRALEGREQALGAAHPDTLDSVNNLANLLSDKGDYEAAEPLYRRALEGRKQALGAEHPDTLASVNNLANLLHEKGDYEAAEPLYRRALEGNEQALGAAHPSTLTSVNNLAVLLRIKGDYEAAEPLYRRALEGYEQALGAAHPSTLNSVHNLANLLSNKGDYAAAEPLYRRALEGYEQALGAEHPDTLNSVHNLAVLLSDKGDYEAAEPLYRRALEGYEQALGAAHPSTLNSVHNLANLLSNKGDYAAAEPLYRRALEGYEQALGAEHPDTLASVNNLANLLHEKGDYEAAEPLYRRALEGNEQALGAAHPSTLMSAFYNALTINRLGEPQKAAEVLRRFAYQSDEAMDMLGYNLACYECLSGNEAAAKDLIADIIRKHPENKEQALADEDFTSIREFIEALPNPKNEQ